MPSHECVACGQLYSHPLTGGYPKGYMALACPTCNKTYKKAMEESLKYCDKLNEINTDDVLPTLNVTGLVNITRDDVIVPNLTQKEATMNGSKVKDGYFVTKAVLET